LKRADINNFLLIFFFFPPIYREKKIKINRLHSLFLFVAAPMDAAPKTNSERGCKRFLCIYIEVNEKMYTLIGQQQKPFYYERH